MFVGLLTGCFRDTTLENIIDFAGKNGIEGIEIAGGAGHPIFDPTTVTPDRMKELAKRCADNGVAVTALACYTNLTSADDAANATTSDMCKKAIDLCHAAGTDVFCTLAGIAPQGKSREETIAEIVPRVWPPLLEHAGQAGVKVAFENWVGTVIMNIAQWRLLFEQLPQENAGLNYDPSHLIWQQIDYIGAVHEFAPRIFHCHAKDTEIRQHDLRIVGNNGRFWRYVIPGLGAIDWGQLIAALRTVGYNGTLSIEHEDGTVGVEEGLIMAERFLRQFLAGRNA